MIKEFARAKINLTLDILGKRADGYHEVEMIMQTLELADIIELETADEIILKKTKSPAPLIGQQRAVEAIDFGLSVNGRGYNIFITGQPDNGRTSYTLEKFVKSCILLLSTHLWISSINCKVLKNVLNNIYF